MGLVIDAIILAIVAITVFISAKRGFVRVAIELVGFIAAVVLSFTISTPLADATYDKIIEPPIISAVTNATEDATESKLTEVRNNALSFAPDWVKDNIDKIGINEESFNKSVSANINGGINSAVASASREVIKPALTKIIRLVYIVLLMIILIFTVKLLAKLVNKLFSFSVIGKLNSTLGGIFGIPKGVILAMLFCFILAFIVTVTKNGVLIFNKDAINSSLLFDYFTLNF